MVPDLSRLDLTIFIPILVQKQHTFGRNLSSNSEFLSFPELASEVQYSLWFWQAEPPVSHVIRKVSKSQQVTATLYPFKHSVFYFSTAFDEDEIDPTLYYKMGFVLDDFSSC